MNSWILIKDIEETIAPEINEISKQAGILWKIESIIEENILKRSSYEEFLNFIADTKRDASGRSDLATLSYLFSLMQPQHRSKATELGKNLFHIYFRL